MRNPRTRSTFAVDVVPTGRVAFSGVIVGGARPHACLSVTSRWTAHDLAFHLALGVRVPVGDPGKGTVIQ